MPERSRIHSSEESIRSTSSELGTTRSGRYPPTPQMRACRAPSPATRVPVPLGVGAVRAVSGVVVMSGLQSGAGRGGRAEQVAGRVEVVRGLEGDRLDALHGALGQADEGAGGGEL